MPEPIHEETYKGLRFEVVLDVMAENPRKDYDHVGTMWCLHRKYSLGDDHNYSEPAEVAQAILAEAYGEDVDMPERDDDKIAEALDAAPVFVLPLYLYDHSGITMRTTPFSDPWDSGQVGLIFVTGKKAHQEWPMKSDEGLFEYVQRIYGYLRNEVAEYDCYLRAEVCGYVVLDHDDDDEPKELDSCFGIYGADEAIRQAKEFIDAATQP